MQFHPIAVLLETLRFMTRRWATIVRLTWVPMMLALGAGLALGAASGRPYSGDPLDAEVLAYYVADFTAYEFGLVVLQAPLVAVSAVAIHRLVLFNADRPREAAPFAIGPTDGLYMLMGVALGLLFLLADAALFVPAHLFFTGEAPTLTAITRSFWGTGGGIPALALYVGAWLSYALLAVLWTRILVWPASVVARETMSWGESWALTEGKFWRILALVVIALAIIWTLDTLSWLLSLSGFNAMGPNFWGHALFAVSNSATYWLIAVFLAALASFAYKSLRGYRPEEMLR